MGACATRFGTVQAKIFTKKELKINWVERVTMNVARSVCYNLSFSLIHFKTRLRFSSGGLSSEVIASGFTSPLCNPLISPKFSSLSQL